jgi:hypothetical protein
MNLCLTGVVMAKAWRPSHTCEKTAELPSCSMHFRDLQGFVGCLAQVRIAKTSRYNILNSTKGLCTNLAHPSMTPSYLLRIANQVLVVQLSLTCTKLAPSAQLYFAFIRVLIIF